MMTATIVFFVHDSFHHIHNDPVDGVSLHKEARKPRGALAVIGTQAMGRGRKRTNDVIASCDVLDGRRLELIKTPTADCFVFPYVGSKRGTQFECPTMLTSALSV